MISDPTADPTLDRLLRHMAWANAVLFDRLAECSDEALALASPRNEWTVAMILQHLVDAAGGYAARLEGVPRPERTELPATIAELSELGARCAAYDARIRAQAALPDGSSMSPDRNKAPRARSTVVGQASITRPSTGHRSQAPSRPTGSTRSTSTRSTSGRTAMRRASGPRHSPADAWLHWYG